MRITALLSGLIALLGGCDCSGTKPTIDSDAATDAGPDDDADLANHRGRTPGINRPPSFRSTPPLTGIEGEAYRYAPDIDDLDGDLVVFTLDEAPPGMSISESTGAMFWIPGPSDAGDHAVRCTASDEAGATIDQSWTISVEARNVAPRIVSEPANVATEGAAWRYAIEAVDDDGDPLTYYLAQGPAGMAIDALGVLSWADPTPGATSVVIQVSDPTGEADAQSFHVVQAVPGDVDPPVVSITRPSVDASIRERAEVVGTADDDALAFYTLEACAADDSSNCREITRGFGPVHEGLLGLVHASALEARAYDLTLRATDASGLHAETSRRITIEAGVQGGGLRLGFVDMNVTVGALDVEVRREYREDDTNQGEFGRGWTLATVVTPEPEEQLEPVVELPAEPLGLGWTVSGTLFPYADSEPKPVTFKLPDGRQYVAVFDPTVEQGTIGGHILSEHFLTPDGCSVATYPPVDQLILRSGSEQLELYDGIEPLGDYAPERITLTTQFGEEFEFDVETGELLRFRDEEGVDHDWVGGTGFDIDSVVEVVRDGDRVVEIRNRMWEEKVVYGYEDGNLVSVDYVGGDYDSFGAAPEQTFQYGDDHVMDGFATEGNAVRYVVRDELGRIIRKVDGTGGTTEYVYDDEARRRTVISPSGARTVYEYDERGNILRIVDPMGGVTRYEYDDRDHEVAVIDAMGRRRETAYDAADNITRIREADGSERIMEYDADNRLTRAVDGEGNEYEIRYTGEAGSSEFSAAVYGPGGEFLGSETTDTSGRPVTQVDAFGQTTTYEYDGDGRLAALADPGSQWTVDYRSRSGLEKTYHNETTGQDIALRSDSQGNVRQVDHPAGGSLEYDYNGAGQVRRARDPSGREINLRWNDAGHLERISSGGAVISQTQFTAEGLPRLSLSENGTVTRNEFDATGQITATEGADGRREMRRDAVGQLVDVMHPDGTHTALGYDMQGRVNTLTNPMGRNAELAYDTANHPTRFTDAMGRTTVLEYDAFGNRSGAAFPGMGMLHEQYDNRRDTGDGPPLVSRTWPTGERWSYDYDDESNLSSVIDPLGGMTTYGYDDGQLRSVTRPDGRTIEIGGDGTSVVTMRKPSGATTSWNYQSGMLESIVAADDSVIRYSFDEGALRTTLPDGTQTVRYGDLGRPSRTESPVARMDYEYDRRGRLTHAISGDGAEIDYVYADVTGLTTSKTIRSPEGETFTTRYTYDEGHRLAGMTDSNGGSWTFRYDAVDRLVQIDRPNGSVTFYRFGALQLPEEIEHRDASGGAFSRVALTYDVSGRVVGMSGTDGDLRFGYDDGGRLAWTRKVAGDGATEWTRSYAYDAVGNMLSETSESESVEYAYGVDDELERISGTRGARTVGHDGRGNLTSVDGGPDGNASLNYDALNLLAGIEGPGESVRYGYDGQGYFVSRSTASRRERCLSVHSQVTGQVECELRYDPDTGLAIEAYAFGPKGVLFGDGIEGPRYAHAGHAGTIVALTDAEGHLAETRTFDEWGRSSSMSTFPFGYNGAYTDWTSPRGAIVQLRARWYDPGIRRFLTEDPAGLNPEDPSSLDRYVYVANDPLNRVDPSGRETLIGLSISMGESDNMRAEEGKAKSCSYRIVAKNLTIMLARFIVENLILGPLMSTLTGGLEDMIPGWKESANMMEGTSSMFCKFFGSNFNVIPVDEVALEVQVDDCGDRRDSFYSCSQIATVVASTFTKTDRALDIVFKNVIPVELKWGSAMIFNDRKEQSRRQTVRGCRASTNFTRAARADHPAVALAIEANGSNNERMNDMRYASAMAACLDCWGPLGTKELPAVRGIGPLSLAHAPCHSHPSLGAILIIVSKPKGGKLRVYYPDVAAARRFLCGA